MKRRHPWSLLVIAVAVAGALLAGSAAAFYSPLVYQYMMTSADTIVTKKATLAAGLYDTTRCVRKVSGTAGSYGVDTLGVGDYFIVSTNNAVCCSVFVNGSTTPKALDVPANGSRTVSVRWVDSVITKDGGSGSTVYLEIDGHKQWFSGGGTY